MRDHKILGSSLSHWPDLDPSELAEIAEVAWVLGLYGLAQVVLNAAYDRGNGKSTHNLARVLMEISVASQAAGAKNKLTTRQCELLRGISLG